MSKKMISRRQTFQKELILKELKKVCNHPTAQQLHKMVQKKMSAISLATVYRNLEILEQVGLIIKLKTKNKEARYDGCAESHCHLFCKNCGKVEDIFDVSGVSINSKELKKINFQIHYDFLELHGLCKKCQPN